MAATKGYHIITVSSSFSAPVKERLLYLGLRENYFSLKDKRLFFEEYLQRRQIQWQEVLFMGDDLPDIPLLKEVAISCCPADAASEVKKVCQYISPFNSGNGCVRDVIEKVLKLNGHWNFETSFAPTNL
jgi:3-deoxy-D-manno-octulosonate 8-phosphate phosphatase (KDO 8-P phosphatase)